MSINIQIANKMKKFNWLLAAAVVATVAACQSDAVLRDVVNPPTDSSRAIGFSSYSEKSTRGDVTNPLYLEYYHSTFTVYASKKSTVDNVISEVFDGGATALVTFSNNATTPNEWTYSPYRYWDKQATYSFVAVAPNSDIITYTKPLNIADNAGTYTTRAAGYTLVGQNLQSTDAPDTIEIKKGFVGGNGDTDLMTAGKITRNGANAITDVNLEFKHILAKLNIAIAKDPTFDNVKVLIKDVTVEGLDDKGTYTESTSAQTSGWISEASANAANYKLTWANTHGIELLKGQGEGDNYKPGKFLYFIALSRHLRLPTRCALRQCRR